MKYRYSTLALIASGALFAAAVAPAHAALDDAAAQALLKKDGCATCHKVDKAGVGPSIQQIAKKRKGQASAVADMKKAVRNGGAGVYGSDAMPKFAEDKISDADLTNVLQWVLTK